MRLPIAAAYLARIAHMTGDGSLARAFDEKRLELRVDDDADRRVEARVRLLAKEDRAIAEEARALATTRSWPLGRGVVPYVWSRLRGARLQDALAEIVRVLARDVFELEGFAREIAGKDDDVASLALRAGAERHALRGALVLLVPAAALPGGK